MAGFAQSSDALRLDELPETHAWLQADLSGRWLAQTIEHALSRANCTSHDVAMVLGNGCGVAAYDQRELAALRSVFGHPYSR